MADVEAHIHVALMARVQSMSLTPSLALQYPGISDRSIDVSGEYARVTHLPNEPDRWGIKGSSAMDRTGFLILDLFTRITEGSWQGLAVSRAGQIAAHFPADLRLSDSGYEVKIEKSYPGIGRKDPNGTHWHTPVEIQYRGTA